MMKYLDDALAREGQNDENEQNDDSVSQWSQSECTFAMTTSAAPVQYAPRAALLHRDSSASPQREDAHNTAPPPAAGGPNALSFSDEHAEERGESWEANGWGMRRPTKLKTPTGTTPPGERLPTSQLIPSAGLMISSEVERSAAVKEATACCGAAQAVAAISSTFPNRLHHALPAWRERDLGPLTPSSCVSAALSQDLSGFESRRLDLSSTRQQISGRSAASSRISWASTEADDLRDDLPGSSSRSRLSVRVAEVDEMSEEEVRAFAKQLQLKVAASHPTRSRSSSRRGARGRSHSCSHSSHSSHAAEMGLGPAGVNATSAASTLGAPAADVLGGINQMNTASCYPDVWEGPVNPSFASAPAASGLGLGQLFTISEAEEEHDENDAENDA